MSQVTFDLTAPTWLDGDPYAGIVDYEYLLLMQDEEIQEMLLGAVEDELEDTAIESES